MIFYEVHVLTNYGYTTNIDVRIDVRKYKTTLIRFTPRKEESMPYHWEKVSFTNKTDS